MGKILIYASYLTEFLRHLDIVSMVSSVKYLLFRKSHKHDRIVKSSQGYFFCRKNTNDFQFANLAYERSVKKFILQRIESFDAFFDAGACIGDYSVLLSRYGLKCYAFEPIPDTFNILSRNILLNEASDSILPFSFGLGDFNHFEKFVFNQVNTGDSHIVRTEGTGNCTVQVKTLDSVFNSFNLGSDVRILFKLDVEGMEKEALYGAREFIRYFDSITFIIESTHTPALLLKETLDQIAEFSYGIVDAYNIYAIKKCNFSTEVTAAG